jgi:cyanophycin synthetase
MAKALMAEGIGDDCVSIIPDEQAAIEAALKMGQPGDLLLIFADALTRSWKQITKFRPAGVATAGSQTGVPAHAAAFATTPALTDAPAEPAAFTSLEGLLRDERGIRLAPEVDD